MGLKHEFIAYYQTLREINYAVFGVIATAIYTLIYICIVPFVAILAPARKKMTHTAWSKWTYTADTLEDMKKQY